MKIEDIEKLTIKHLARIKITHKNQDSRTRQGPLSLILRLPGAYINKKNHAHGKTRPETPETSFRVRI